MEPTQAEHTPPFKITRQDHQATFDPDNPESSSWTIYFQTRLGVQSFVVIPDSRYNAENVADTIGQRADEIDRVQQINGHQS